MRTAPCSSIPSSPCSRVKEKKGLTQIIANKEIPHATATSVCDFSGKRNSCLLAEEERTSCAPPADGGDVPFKAESRSDGIVIGRRLVAGYSPQCRPAVDRRRQLCHRT